MSSVAERERKLIEDLWLKRITEEEFCRAFPVNSDQIGRLGREILRRAIHERDSDGVEYGLSFANREPSNEYFELLTVLANEDWHHSHEDVISILGGIRSPDGVDVLYRSALAKHKYLEFDEAFALGVKAIWALYKIGTPEAVARLGALLHSGNAVLESNAAERLRAIAHEASSQEVRDAAHNALASQKGDAKK